MQTAQVAIAPFLRESTGFEELDRLFAVGSGRDEGVGVVAVAAIEPVSF